MHMQAHSNSHIAHDPNEGDREIVSIWLRKDRARWIAGALAGAFAGILALVFAMVLSRILGQELWFPVKLAALPFLGNGATALGMHLGAIGMGLVAHEIVCMVLGVAYAHFTGREASLPQLLGIGLTWGVFSWIFIQNLFVQSFTAIRAASIPSGAAFPVLVVFGISLTSVTFFDRMVRRN